MLNKNDPLIGAVQEVMKRNHAEREATRLVNEKFGIADRKALPHERQREWDSAYQQVLSESSFAALAPPYDKATQKDRLVGAGVLKKHPTKPGKHILAKEEQLDEKKMTDAQMAKREEIVKSMKKGMPGFKKRYGERSKDVMYATATKQAMSEAVSPGAREPDAATGSVGKTPWYRPIQAARKDNYADRMNQNTRLRIAKEKGTTGKLSGDDAWQNRIRDPKVQQQANWPDRKPSENESPKAQPVAQSNPSPFKFTDDERKGKVSAERLKQWKASQGVGGEKLGLGNFLNSAQGKTARAGGKNDMSQQQKTYNIKRSNADRMNESIRNIIAEKMMKEAMGNSGTASSWTGPAGSMNPMDRRTDMQRATQNAGAMATQRMAAQKDAAAKKSTGINAATGKLEPTDTQRRAGMSITNVRDAAYGKNPTAKKLGPASSTGGQGPSPVPTSSQAAPLATGTSNKVAMTARKIEAPVRKVSATEIMNSKQYKQGVKDVGGEAAARRIKPGTNVAGVGQIKKGETIYGNVEKQLSRTAVKGFEAGNTKGGAGR